MLKLELDWAADLEPDQGVACDDGEALVFVAYDDKPGPAGWPTVTVYAYASNGSDAARAGMALDAWLRDAYGIDSDEERDDLIELSEVL